MTVRLAVLDLDRRLAVLRAADRGHPTFPHALRGALAAMLAVPTWDVELSFDAMTPRPLPPDVVAVVDQGRRWASEQSCTLTVTFRGMASPHAPVEQ